MTTQEIGMATEEIVADVAEVEEVAAPASPRSATARTAAAATMVDEDEAPAARGERPRAGPRRRVVDACGLREAPAAVQGCGPRLSGTGAAKAAPHAL